MRRAARSLARIVAVLALALALPLAAQAAHKPQPKPHRCKPPMSSGIPYIAPWQSGFEKFATQVVTPTVDGTKQLVAKVPANQWYRIVYMDAQFSTNNTVGNRTVSVKVIDRQGNTLFNYGFPAAQVALTTATYVAGPSLTTFANQADVNNEWLSLALPDVLWPPGATIEFSQPNVSTFDNWIGTPSFAFEVYTEQRSGALAPVAPIPTPKLV